MVPDGLVRSLNTKASEVEACLTSSRQKRVLTGMPILAQRCRDVNVDVHMCFIDYEKAFDLVHHDKLIEVLNKIGLDGRDIRIIANLYWYQSAIVRVESQLIEEIPIRKGAKDVFSHQYYSTYTIYRSILYIGIYIYIKKPWMKEWKVS